MFKRIVTSALIFGMAAIGPPAEAQGFCARRDLLVRQLETELGERPLLLALKSPVELLEFWVRPDGSGWTLLVSRPDGVSCVVALGSGWGPAAGPPDYTAGITDGGG